tara:strand:- start:4859 stop:5512 length:654 start_codon:yes stop_codon:yes gene_type:complete
MKNVKLTNKDRHQGVHTVQFAYDVTSAKVEEFMDKPQYLITAINLGQPLYSFTSKEDNKDVLVEAGEEFELKMTEFFYKKVAGYKKDDVITIDCRYSDKWNYAIARTNTVNVPNTQTYSNGAATIPDAASRMALAKHDKRIVAEGQVRFGFAKEAFRMGLELNKGTKTRIEEFTDYVMTERYANTVEPPSPNDPDSRPKPPPHTDAEVPQEEEALPF